MKLAARKYWTSFWKTQIELNWSLWRNKSDRLHEKGRKKRSKKKQPKVEISEISHDTQLLQRRSTSTLPVGSVSPRKGSTERMKRVVLRWQHMPAIRLLCITRHLTIWSQVSLYLTDIRITRERPTAPRKTGRGRSWTRRGSLTCFTTTRRTRTQVFQKSLNLKLAGKV